MNTNEYNLRFNEIRTLEATPKGDRFKLNIKDVKKGSFIKIYGEMFKVGDLYTYTYKKDSWNELQLVSSKNGAIRYLEIEEDDTIAFTLTEKELKVRNFPISMDDVEEMSEDESGTINIDGTDFFYEDDYKVKFNRQGSDRTDKVYLYEFESDNKEYLTIEEWDDGDEQYSYEIFISKDLPASAIEIVAI